MINQLINNLKNKTSQIHHIAGLYGSADAYVISRLIAEGFFVFAVAGSDDMAENLMRNSETLQSMFNNAVPHKGVLFPADDPETRMQCLGQLSAARCTVRYCICSLESFTMPVASPQWLEDNRMVLSLGASIPRKKLFSLCEQAGYTRETFVEQPGHIAIRGEVVDLWVPGEKDPVRLLYPGETIESIRVFDVGTQRSQKIAENVMIYPAKEKPETPFFTCVDFFTTGPKVLIMLPAECSIETAPDGWQRIVHSPVTDQGKPLNVFSAIPDFQKNFLLFGNTLTKWKNEKYRTIIFSHNTGEVERLQELLYEHCRAVEQYPEHRIGLLTQGFVEADEKLACVANGDIFGRYHRTFRLPRFTGGKIMHSLGDIRRGDYVVHEKYGIGKYQGLEEITTHDQINDFLKIEYRGHDFLYVPVDDFQKVQKYIGGEGVKPSLYSLDGVAWEHLKKRVKKGVREIAEELLRTQAARMLKTGFAFSQDTHMEREFAASFMYPETPDQSRTIQEVLADMGNIQPMDRVVCGDVGYGKTEIAMRAAFKAAVNSCQVAVLTPTTILAEQHYYTFAERMADYPVNSAMLSRFQSKKEQKQILKELREGLIDIVIGTHRLLQNDVVFKNLKLIIIDEEHRFGVRHKERFKNKFPAIDILTLTATPIPRTLYMGLSGVRELSLIETPPEGRVPIQTYIGPYDESLIRTALAAEINRGGQIFYVYNRIETMPQCIQKLKEIMPSIVYACVHGRMKSDQIEETMWNFMHKKIDCLIATSIIESGIDIPNANTLIVEEAHDMGLAQLYQLRGRVGRERAVAHCFLLYHQETVLNPEAQKRLGALREFTALGSGFHLAMRDLEIRGCGSLLGDKQHGFIKDIGFDYYCRLLKEEIERQKGGVIPASTEDTVEEGPKLDIQVQAYFPPDYIPHDSERIRMYRKAMAASNAKDLTLLEEELNDRFGPLPEPATLFLQLMVLRQHAKRLKVKEVIEKNQEYLITFNKNDTMPQDVIALAEKYKTHIYFKEHKNTGEIYIKKEAFSSHNRFEQLKNFLSEII